MRRFRSHLLCRDARQRSGRIWVIHFLGHFLGPRLPQFGRQLRSTGALMHEQRISRAPGEFRRKGSCGCEPLPLARSSLKRSLAARAICERWESTCSSCHALPGACNFARQSPRAALAANSQTRVPRRELFAFGLSLRLYHRFLFKFVCHANTYLVKIY